MGRRITMPADSGTAASAIAIGERVAAMLLERAGPDFLTRPTFSKVY